MLLSAITGNSELDSSLFDTLSLDRKVALFALSVSL
jgi:hypothetical protein